MPEKYNMELYTKRYLEDIPLRLSYRTEAALRMTDWIIDKLEPLIIRKVVGVTTTVCKPSNYFELPLEVRERAETLCDEFQFRSRLECYAKVTPNYFEFGGSIKLYKVVSTHGTSHDMLRELVCQTPYLVGGQLADAGYQEDDVHFLLVTKNSDRKSVLSDAFVKVMTENKLRQHIKALENFIITGEK